MQTNHQDIYKTLAEENGKSEQTYKDIGSFIFRETSKMLKEPTSLILKLKGVGSWHLRKKRMQIVINEYPERALTLTREDFTSDDVFSIYVERHKQYMNFLERMKEYEKYLEIKIKIRKKRHESQVLLQPTQGEDERFKSR